MAAISDPDTAVILIVSGVLAIYAEFCCPGRIVPGVAGAMLALAGLASLLHNTLNWRGGLLVFIAFSAFALEAKWITRGAFTIAGAAALMAGSVLLVDSPDPARRIHWVVAAAVAIPFAPITSFLLSVAVRARHNKIGERLW